MNNTTKQNVDFQEGQSKSAQELPPGWVEAKDPTTGASYFFNQSTGANGIALVVLRENWEEAIDESTGQKYCYNTTTQATQWEPPTSGNPGVVPHAPTNAAVQLAAQNADLWNPHMQRCLGCGGWGVSLVQPWGYCNHCTRVQNLPFQQYPFYPNNMCTQVVPMLLKVRGMLQLRTDRAQNPHFAKQTEKIATKEITLRMMSLTQWIQALTQMLHRVAGLSA